MRIPAARTMPWRRATPTIRAWLLAISLVALLAGCASGGSSTKTSAPGTTDTAGPTTIPAACANATVSALEGVAAQIYREVAHGRIVAQALNRVLGSTALRQAVQNGEAAATRRALRGLAASQIIRIRVTHGSHTLADIGARDAIAPSTGHLLGSAGQTIGEVALSVQGVDGYIQTVLGATGGAQVLVHNGPHLLAGALRPAPAHIPTAGQLAYRGVTYRVVSFPGLIFPSSPAVFSLLMSPSLLSQCAAGATAPSTAQIGADTIGAVAMRVYQSELKGRRVRAVVRQVERSPAFREAVEHHDPAVARAAIIGLFRSRLHVVRVRVNTTTGLLVDVGGPFVLAPVQGTLRSSGGRVIGHFLLAIQDDLGYVLLTHAFTGAQVLLRQGSRQVMGSLRPGPARIPDRGAVSYGGVSYRAFSFTGRAFPSGQLRISVLVPSG